MSGCPTFVTRKTDTQLRGQVTAPTAKKTKAWCLIATRQLLVNGPRIRRLDSRIQSILLIA